MDQREKIATDEASGEAAGGAVGRPESRTEPRGRASSSEELSQIVYLSTRSDDVVTSQIVDDIVLPAMRKNYQRDITGCLWFGPAHFVQVLEGPTKDVFATYVKIKVDKRHHSIRLLNSGAIAERRFERFSMKVIESDECAAINRLIAQFAAPGLDDPLSDGDEHDRMSAHALVDVMLRWMSGTRGSRAK
jgi:hypothetical protein